MLWQFTCPYCRKPIGIIADNLGDEATCPECFSRVTARGASAPDAALSAPEETPSHSTTDDDAGGPALSTAFRIAAVLEMAGGLILCRVFWPGDAGDDYSWKAGAYMMSITWLFSGLLFGMLFLAIAEVLHYLKRIATARPYPVGGR